MSYSSVISWVRNLQANYNEDFDMKKRPSPHTYLLGISRRQYKSFIPSRFLNKEQRKIHTESKTEGHPFLAIAAELYFLCFNPPRIRHNF